MKCLIIATVLFFLYAIIATYKEAKQQGRKVTQSEKKSILTGILFCAVLYTGAYLIILKDEKESQEQLQYEIEQCLKRNRHLTYKQCKNDAIDQLNFREEMSYSDTDSPPQYR